MNKDPRTQPLQEWNRLARENTENAIVSSMFEAMAKASEPINKFATWLLVAAAAVASSFIGNAEKLLLTIKQQGFVTCGVFLCLSCIFGLLSKIFALRCKVASETGAAVRKTFAAHLATYQIEEEKIQEGASFWGIDLQTGIRLERILKEFLAPMPWWVRWWANRYFAKHAGNPQIGYYISHVRSLHAQGVHAFLQALCFLGFLGSGFIFAAPI